MAPLCRLSPTVACPDVLARDESRMRGRVMQSSGYSGRMCAVDISSPWRDLVEVARWAPSPHNTQPWVVRPLDPERAELFLVRRRRLPDEDTTGCFVICAMGIFIEALRIAAANRGMRLVAESQPTLDHDRELIPFAQLSLAPSAPRDEFTDASILERRTSRLPSLPEPLGAAVEERLTSIARRHGHRFDVIADPRLIARVLDVNARTLMRDLNEPKYLAEIRRWYRYSEAHARRSCDGLEARCMNMPGYEMWLSAHAPWLARVPGIGALMRWGYQRRVGRCERMFLLSGPFFDRSAAERAGPMFLRLALALHVAGGAMHPFGSLVTNRDAHAWLTRTTGIGDIWFIARFGRTLPPPRSLRMGVEEVLHA